jgi:hypothetical protein
MSPGAKVFLTLAGIGAVVGGIVIFSSKKAKAATLPASDTDDTAPPDVIVPEVDQLPGGLQPSGTVPPFVPPFPQFTPTPGPAPSPQPFPQQPPPPQTVTLPTPVGPITVPLPAGPTVPVTVPVPLPDVLAQQPAGAQPPPPPIVQLPPIVSTPPGPVPLPPILTAPPSIPLPQPVLAPAPAPLPVSTVPKDTAAMVSALLTAETKIGWNIISSQVKAWQKSRGLVEDGKYGPKSALTVAAELATVPIIRFWPKGSQKAPELDKYRTALFELASQTNDPNRADQLRFAAEREKAQSFGVLSGKAPPISPELQVALAKVA